MRMLYPNPLPVPASLGQHYDVAPETYWDDHAFWIGPNFNSHNESMFRQLTGHDPQGRVALDIGAGAGAKMKALESIGFDVYGLEPSPSFRSAAIERAGVRPERLQLASVEEAEYEPESFDLIFFADVLEHLVDPSAMLEKTVRWLKRDGVMKVHVPSSQFLGARVVRAFYRLTGADFVVNTSPMHSPFHLYEFTTESFRRHSVKSGYEIVHSVIEPPATLVPPLFRAPVHKLMRWTGSGMMIALWVKRTR